MTLMLAFLLACVSPGQLADDDLDALLNKAVQAESEGRFGSAVSLLKQVIEADPDHVRALNRLARIHATARDTEFFSGRLAVEYALRAHDKAPDDMSVVETLAEGYFAQAQFERAIAELSRCIDAAPDDPRYFMKHQRYALEWNRRLDTLPVVSPSERGAALFNLGQAAFSLEEHEKAVTYLKKSLQFDGAPREAAGILSMALMALGEPGEAVEVLNTTDLDISTDPQLLHVMGRASLMLDEAENAVAYFMKAIDLDSGIEDIKGDLGMALLVTGRNERAAAMLQEALDALARGSFRTDAKRAELLVLCGRALERLARCDEALAMYYEATTIGVPGNKGEGHLKKLFAEKYSRMGDLREFLTRERWPDAVFFEPVSNTTGVSGTGGAIWNDFDRDGDPDLLLGCTRLFRNEGRSRFRDFTARARLEVRRSASGIFADIDVDGFPDIFVFSTGYRSPCRLLKNCGNGVFIDVIKYTGIPDEALRARNGALGDLDGDGLPDLFLLQGEGKAGRRQPARLFLNVGAGRFEENTEEAGISSLDVGAGSAVLFTDFDNDGDMDIFVANSELEPNTLWRNDGAGRFVDCAAAAGLRGRDVNGAFGNSVCALAGDLDGDGDQDFFVANVSPLLDMAFADRSQFLLSSGRPDFVFHDAVDASGIRCDEYHSHAALGDIDNDGDLDLFITEERQGRFCRLYANDGAGRFSDVTWLAGLMVPNAAGSSLADYDGDGDLDLFVSAGKGELFENKGNGNHWIAFRLLPKEKALTAVSAKVMVHAGNLSLERAADIGGQGTGFQNSPVIHFGLGGFRDKATATVRWADGRSLYLENLKVDRVHTVRDKGK